MSETDPKEATQPDLLTSAAETIGAAMGKITAQAEHLYDETKPKVDAAIEQALRRGVFVR